MANRELIRLSKSCIGEDEKQAVVNVLDREYLGMGADVQNFENCLKDYFKRDVTCVVNGTAAIQLALQACGVGMYDEVLIPSLTYVASFQAISATGATPIACDIDPETLIIDLTDAENRLSDKTKAIIPVHYTGGVGNLAEIYRFAAKHNLRVIEDAAHAFGTVYDGELIGSFGDIACFSFDGIKNITSGEGGCIVTNDRSVVEKVRDLRLLAVEKDTEKRYSGQRSWEFDVKMQGWRYHMSNIMAAIGIAQFNKRELFFQRRREFAKLYDELFADSSFILPVKRNYTDVVPHIYVVQIPTMSDRRKLQEKLLELGVQTGIHYFPNHFLEMYGGLNVLPLTVTEKIFPQILTLPLHPDLSEKDVLYVAQSLRTIVEK